MVAQWFSRYVESAVQLVSNVELKTYSLYEDGIIHIENVYGGKGKKIIKEPSTSTRKETPVQTDRECREQEEEISYTVESHTASLPEDLREAFETVRSMILELP